MTNSIETLKTKIAAQAARIEQLTAENVALRNQATSAMNTIMQSIYEYWEDRCHINQAFKEILNIETPATDAALREIQAQAIIKAAQFIPTILNRQHLIASRVITTLETYAAQVKAGEVQL